MFLTTLVLSLTPFPQTSPLPVGQQGRRRGPTRARVSFWKNSRPQWPTTALLTRDWCCLRCPSSKFRLCQQVCVTCGSNNWYNAEQGKEMQASLRLVAQIAEPVGAALKNDTRPSKFCDKAPNLKTIPNLIRPATFLDNTYDIMHIILSKNLNWITFFEWAKLNTFWSKPEENTNGFSGDRTIPFESFNLWPRKSHKKHVSLLVK